MALYGTHTFAQTAMRPTAVSQKYAPWQLLNEAYDVRDDGIIAEYARNAHGADRLYAQALQELIRKNIHLLQKTGHMCMAYKVKTDDDAAATFGCLFAVATGSKLFIDTNSYITWLINLKDFYNKHRHAIDVATKTGNPANIESIRVPDITVLSKWPKEEISVNKVWRSIPLHKGTVDGLVNGVHVKFIVDTGTSSSVYLSNFEMKRLGIEKNLAPLGASFYARDNTGGARVSLFYAKHLSVGPIHARNVYVDVGPGDSSYIGLNLLRKLHKFSISADEITHLTNGHAAACGSMRWVRMPVTQAFSYPFMSIYSNDSPFGLFLDSGMHIRTQNGNSDMYVSSRGANILRRSSKVTPLKTRNIIMAQNGKLTKFRLEQFDTNIGKLPVTASTMPDAMFVSDPAVDGVLTYGFLKKGFVYYDFVDRRMCIGRIVR